MIDLLSRTSLSEEAELSAAEQALSQSYTELWGAQRQIKQIPLESIRAYRTPDGKAQPYRLRPWKVDTIAASMEDIGVLQPLVVRALEDDEYEYEVLVGHHRFFAARKLGFATIPCEVKNNISDKLAYKMVSESNPPKQRDKPMPSEYAEIFKAYMDQRGSDTEDRTAAIIAKKFDVSRRQIYRYLAVNDLPRNLIEALDEGMFPFGQVEDALNSFTQQQLSAIGEYISYCNKKIGKPQLVKLKDMAAEGIEFDVDEISDYLNRPAITSEDEEQTDEAMGNNNPRIYSMLRAIYGDVFDELTNGEIEEILLKLVEEHIREI